MSRKRPTGRPPIYDTPASVRLSLAVTPAQRLDLKQVAAESRTGLSGLLREAVNEFVSDYRERQVFCRKKP